MTESIRLAASLPEASTRSRYVRAILVGGCSAGLVDIGAACIIYSLNPLTLLKGIATGLLGEAAAEGGLGIALIGFVLQLGMSVLIAAICVAVRRRVTFVNPNWIMSGFVYGMVIFVVMNYLVMPLSAVGRHPHFSAASFVKNLCAMWVFGLIIAYCTRSIVNRSSSPIAG